MTSLTSQGLWILFAKILGFGLNFMLPLLIVRYLAQDQVGTYRQVFLVVANAVTILPLGFSLSAYYFLNREPENRSSTVFHILLFNFVAGGVAFCALFFFPQLLGIVFQNQAITLHAPQIGLVVWVWTFSSFLEIAVLANQESKLAGVLIILAQLTKTILMIGAVMVAATVEAIIYAAIGQAVIQICILFVYLMNRFPLFWKSFNWRFFRRQFAYALPFGLASLLFTVQSDVHNYFVSYGFGPAEFAIYSIGCFQLPLIAILYESVGVVVIPRMSQLQAAGKKLEMLLMVVSGTQKLSFFYFPIFVFLMITAEEFIITLFTNVYAGSVPIFRVNLLTLPIFCLLTDPIARAYAEVGTFLLKLRIALLISLTVILWYSIEHVGLPGIISIAVVFFLIEKIAAAWKSLQMLDVNLKDIYLFKNLLKTAAAALSSGILLSAFYLLVKVYLLEFLFDASSRGLFFIQFEVPAARFVSGSLFLGICLGVYSLLYLLFAYWLNVPESQEVIKFWKRFAPRLEKGEK